MLVASPSVSATLYMKWKFLRCYRSPVPKQLTSHARTLTMRPQRFDMLGQSRNYWDVITRTRESKRVRETWMEWRGHSSGIKHAGQAFQAFGQAANELARLLARSLGSKDLTERVFEYAAGIIKRPTSNKLRLHALAMLWAMYLTCCSRPSQHSQPSDWNASDWRPCDRPRAQSSQVSSIRTSISFSSRHNSGTVWEIRAMFTTLVEQQQQQQQQKLQKIAGKFVWIIGDG